jgi:copper(I)-binding protein
MTVGRRGRPRWRDDPRGDGTVRGVAAMRRRRRADSQHIHHGERLAGWSVGLPRRAVQKEVQMFRTLVIAATMILGAAAASAESASVQVDHPWSRASTGRTGAVYMTIKNSGASDDKLVAAASPVAGKVELHIEMMDNGVMKMRPLPSIDVKANGETMLKPGGMHVMLIGLKHPLKQGETFPLTLTFEKAGKVDVTVTIEKAGSMGGMKM